MESVKWCGLVFILMISHFTISSGIKFDNEKNVVLVAVNTPSGVLAKLGVKHKHTDVVYTCEPAGPHTPRLGIDENTGKLSLLIDVTDQNVLEINNTIYTIKATSESKVATAEVLIIVLKEGYGDQFVEETEKKLKGRPLPKHDDDDNKKTTPGKLIRFLRKISKSAEESSTAQFKTEIAIAIIKKKIVDRFQKIFGKKVKIYLRIHISALFSQQNKEVVENKCTDATTAGKCPKTKGKTETSYRTFDGTCNNLNKHRSHYGAAGTAFIRLLQAKYYDIDGLNDPIGYPNQPNAPDVPSPLEVSRDFIKDEVAVSAPSLKLTHAVMQFGQFLDHDLDLAVDSEGSHHCENVSCDGSSSDFIPPCFPILPFNDTDCIRIVRSAAICQTDYYSAREQINTNSGFIDASQVYGSDEDLAEYLRDKSTSDEGLMRTSQGPGNVDLLPLDDRDGAPTQLCSEISGCYLAGDARVNEQTSLASFQTLFLREHNRIARELKTINSHWDGERLYQESRKIVGAIFQKIVYEDYLPLILGPNPLPVYHGYKKDINPGISNSFAAGAFRFGHSQIRPKFDVLNNNFDPFGPGAIKLRHMFFNNTFIKEHGIKYLLFGLVGNASENVDNTMSSGVTEHLFERTNSPGLNLAAMNIQRSRDHGLPGYYAWRQFCGLSDAKTFQDTKNEITDPKNREILSRLYNDDTSLAELWVAGLAEAPAKGGVVGETFRCIIADQFRRSRDGDRFFYQSKKAFSKKKRAEIEKSSLSRIYCDNLGGIVSIQRDAFCIPGSCGGRIICGSIDGIDLNKWKEKK